MSPALSLDDHSCFGFLFMTFGPLPRTSCLLWGSLSYQKHVVRAKLLSLWPRTWKKSLTTLEDMCLSKLRPIRHLSYHTPLALLARESCQRMGLWGYISDPSHSRKPFCLNEVIGWGPHNGSGSSWPCWHSRKVTFLVTASHITRLKLTLGLANLQNSCLRPGVYGMM